MPGILCHRSLDSKPYSLVVFQDRLSEFLCDLNTDLVQELGGEFSTGKNKYPVIPETLFTGPSICQEHLFLIDTPEICFELHIQPVLIHGFPYLFAVPGFDPAESLFPVGKDHLVIIT